MIDTIVGWTVFAIIALWFIRDRAIAAAMWLDRHNDETDAIAAADHQEPTRAEVDAGWLDEDRELWIFPDESFFDRVQFEVTILATIDDLPEVSA